MYGTELTAPIKVIIHFGGIIVVDSNGSIIQDCFQIGLDITHFAWIFFQTGEDIFNVHRIELQNTALDKLGAELITIHADSSWESEQIPLESITWQKADAFYCESTCFFIACCKGIEYSSLENFYMSAILIRRYAMQKDRTMPSVHIYRGHSPYLMLLYIEIWLLDLACIH